MSNKYIGTKDGLIGPELDHPEEGSAYLQPAPAAPQEVAQDGEDCFRQLNNEFSKWWMDIAADSEKPPLMIQVAYWWNKKMKSPTYPAEFVEWAYDNYEHRKTGWYSWDDVDTETSFPFMIKEGAKVYTTAELFTEWKRIKEQSK